MVESMHKKWRYGARKASEWVGIKGDDVASPQASKIR
jgi:hypothetical protein